MAAAVWEVCLEELDASMVTEPEVPSEAEVERALRAGFSSLESTGRVANECWSDCERKLVAWGESRDTISAAISQWDTHREVLRAQLAPPGRIAEALRQAEATTSFDRLSPPIPSETVRWAAMNLPFIRSRFTIADLLFYSGRWSPELVDRALDRALTAGIRW